MPDPLADLARLEGVPSALSAARDALDVALRRRGLRPTSATDLAAARRVGADASAELSGDPERWRDGCRAVATELDSLAALVLTAPLQAFARAHVVVASGRVPIADRGRVRGGLDVGPRMQGLARLLTTPTAAPALLVAAVAHAEIAVVAPFGTADDVVARTVERAVLIATGVDPRGVVPVEAGHLRRSAAYRAGLDGYRRGSVDGVRGWVLHCAEAVQAAVEDANGTRSTG